MNKRLSVWMMAVLVGLWSGAQAADGLGIYANNKMMVFNGVGISYQVGMLRFNVGASMVYVVPLGLQGGVFVVLPVGQTSGSVTPYAGGGVEGDLWLLGSQTGFALYPHGLLGIELAGGYGLELRIGYLTVGAGGSATGGFGLGFGVRNPF